MLGNDSGFRGKQQSAILLTIRSTQWLERRLGDSEHDEERDRSSRDEIVRRRQVAAGNTNQPSRDERREAAARALPPGGLAHVRADDLEAFPSGLGHAASGTTYLPTR